MAATAGDLVALFRAEVSDAVTPYLWSDVEAYAYANDAQIKFCERTDGITDATSAACALAVTAASTAFLALHASITQIRSVTRADNGAPIEIINFEDLRARGQRFDGATGVVRTLVIGEEEGKARLHPVPSENVTLKLLVFRRPLLPLSSAGDVIEIKSEYRQGLLYWMKHRAYGKQDAETYDQKAADRAETSFVAFCEQAKQTQRRTRHKSRTVAYGGI